MSTGDNKNDASNDVTHLLEDKDDHRRQTSSNASASSKSSPASARPIQKTLKDRFILDAIIAKGGMGVVYKARDLRKIEAMDTDPYVAIKLLKPGSKTPKKDFINLQRETRKTQMLSHPNIVNVHDFDRDGDIFMMTMEYLKGQALSDKIYKKDQLVVMPRNEAFSIIKSVGKALIYAHSKNIIHCDLKPANIFITNENIVKVLDFGIARAFLVNEMHEVHESLNKGTRRAVTPGYASCEMLEGEIPEPRDDVFALAIIAYELLTGKHPFNRKTCTQASEQGIQPTPIDGLKRKQWKILSKSLSTKREERPDSVQAFINDFIPGSTGEAFRFWALPIFSTLIILGMLTFYLVQNVNKQSIDIVVATPFETLSPSDQEKIISLLEIADAHMMVQRYTEPAGSNALSAYQQILEIHPANPQALSGLSRIADVYVRLANGYIDNGNNQTALNLVEEGLSISPRHEALLKLLEHLK